MSSWLPRSRQAAAIREALEKATDAALAEPVTPQASPVPAIEAWLARLRLLEGVPFSYLVADMRMLPPESLRFFFVDPNWIAALTDGAFSIGRAGSDDLTYDRPASRSLSAAAIAASGVVVRSSVLLAWPGVVVTAKNERGHGLPPLRRELLAPEVLLCLFDGLVESVTFTTPPQAIHADVDPTSAPTRPGSAAGVLRVAELAATLACADAAQLAAKTLASPTPTTFRLGLPRGSR